MLLRGLLAALWGLGRWTLAYLVARSFGKRGMNVATGALLLRLFPFLRTTFLRGALGGPLGIVFTVWALPRILSALRGGNRASQTGQASWSPAGRW